MNLYLPLFLLFSISIPWLFLNSNILHSSSMDRVSRRTQVLNNHQTQTPPPDLPSLNQNVCLAFSPAELTEQSLSDTAALRNLTDGHNMEDCDWLYGLMVQSKLFNPRKLGSRVFVSPDFNQSMEGEMTMKRIEYLLERGVFEGFLTGTGIDAQKRKFAFLELVGMFDHSLAIKLGVHFSLWGGAVKFFGTKRHHEKWLRATENYLVKGCFAVTELGHGSNVPGIETIATYDTKTGEPIYRGVDTISLAVWCKKHATHTIAFSQLNINGTNQGVHAFIVQIRDADGNVCPNIRVADCGHKTGLNGVHNGRIWFDNVRIPKENLLNSVADVSPDGQYRSAIKDPAQRFSAFMALLTSGRVTIAVSAIYSSKIGLSIAVRYALTRRAFSMRPNEPEVVLLEYPSHQRRLLPLLAKTLLTLRVDRNLCIQVSKALLAEYLTARKRNRPFKGLGLEHKNKPSPVVPAQLSSSTLRCSQFQIDTFCLRERDLLNRFVEEVLRRQVQGESKEYASMQSYQLAEDLGRAFSERGILQNFLEVEESQPAGPLKDVLGLLRSMYAVVSMDEDAAFLRYGYFSAENAASVRQELPKLCSELRPHALALVNSFGIPDALLGPIAFDWVEANAWSAVHH